MLKRPMPLKLRVSFESYGMCMSVLLRLLSLFVVKKNEHETQLQIERTETFIFVLLLLSSDSVAREWRQREVLL